jgi:hypothetical protein
MMQRRSFFKTAFSGMLAFFGARRARAQDIAPSIRELAAVILPSHLGSTGTNKVADEFTVWIRDYKPGAEINSGYGHPRTQVTGPNPSLHYGEQLRALGSPITRESVAKALEDAKIDRIPREPNGKHVAADLLAYFYGSSDGEDFLYGVAIERDDCRGLGNSGARPARLS